MANGQVRRLLRSPDISCIARDISDDEGCAPELFEGRKINRAVVVCVTSKREAGRPYRELSGWVFRWGGSSLAIE